MLDTQFIYLASDAELIGLLAEFQTEADRNWWSPANDCYLESAKYEIRRRGLHNGI